MTSPSWIERLSAVDTRWALVAFLLAIDVWAVGLISRSNASAPQKVIWSAVVIVCPIVGCVYWYVVGPKPELT